MFFKGSSERVFLPCALAAENGGGLGWAAGLETTSRGTWMKDFMLFV